MIYCSQLLILTNNLYVCTRNYHIASFNHRNTSVSGIIQSAAVFRDIICTLLKKAGAWLCNHTCLSLDINVSGEVSA